MDWDELQIENLAWQQAILSVSFVEAPLGCINVYHLNDLNILSYAYSGYYQSVNITLNVSSSQMPTFCLRGIGIRKLYFNIMC